MSYAVRKDGLGWRAVGGAADIAVDEDFSATQPVLILPPAPDVDGFIQAVKVGLGGIVAVNSLATLYPLFFPAAQAQNWADVNLLLLDAKTKTVITLAQYNAILNLAVTYNIPLNSI